ncbi:hypothetical protein [Pedococcus sp. 5OH_020]|uniref:hypothetical protein n=1 Tax=Pedococcus sp. 5OH_020 TaxID=2989814 RepID=UPI0022E9F41E|nr:hypothetical protein [Pedococcus sp. 5OH_020]
MTVTTRLSRGHFRIFDELGAALGNVDGDFGVGFEARDLAGRLQGRFETLEEAVKSLQPEYLDTASQAT